MAGDEHEPQQVITHHVFGALLERVLIGQLLHLQLISEYLVLAREHAPAPQVIDRAMFGGRHQPGAGVVRHAAAGPLLERDHQGILGELFRKSDIAQQAREAGDQPRGFDPPHGIDSPMSIRSRHDTDDTIAARAAQARHAQLCSTGDKSGVVDRIGASSLVRRTGPAEMDMRAQFFALG